MQVTLTIPDDLAGSPRGVIVVADTSPINYLILIDQIAILETLYGRILIPHAIQEEMLSLMAPASVRAWAKNPPNWLEILSPSAGLHNRFPIRTPASHRHRKTKRPPHP